MVWRAATHLLKPHVWCMSPRWLQYQQQLFPGMHLPSSMLLINNNNKRQCFPAHDELGTCRTSLHMLLTHWLSTLHLTTHLRMLSHSSTMLAVLSYLYVCMDLEHMSTCTGRAVGKPQIESWTACYTVVHTLQAITDCYEAV